MKKLLLLSFAVLLASFLSTANAQVVDRFLDRRKDAAKGAVIQRTGKEADKGIRKGVNKGLDKIFGSDEADSTSTQTSQASSDSTSTSDTERSSSESPMDMSAMMSAMGITTGTANVKSSYDFEGFINMLVTNYEDGEEVETALYKTYIDKESPDYAMEFTNENGEGESLIIFDSENSLMLTLGESDDGEKTGFAVSYTLEQNDSIMNEEQEAEDAYASYKTGKTKKILGYKCDEYFIENAENEGDVTMWITEELSKELKKSFTNNTTFSGLFVYANDSNGFTLEYIFEDKSTNEKTVMTVTEIDLNKNSSLSTEGYNIMSMDVEIPEETE